jgi:hypothetical protein
MAEEKQIKAVIQGQFNEILPGYGNIANFLYEDNKNDKIGN